MRCPELARRGWGQQLVRPDFARGCRSSGPSARHGVSDKYLQGARARLRASDLGTRAGSKYASETSVSELELWVKTGIGVGRASRA